VPEGPEIHRIADWIRGAVADEVAQNVRFGKDALADHAETLSGRRLESIQPRGKSITFHLEGGWSVFTHTMLYGRWYVLERGGKPKGKKKVAFAFDTDEHTVMLTSTNRVDVHRAHELETHSFLSKLGPDVLHDATTPATARRALEKHADVALGESLLNQSMLAGIGNYLRAEILFLAGLHPDTTPSDLSHAALSELSELVVGVPRRAYEAEGFTTSDDYIAQGQADGRDRKELKRWIYKKDGAPCPTCATPIVREDHAKRAFYRCPSCQPA
jgi:endonuclease-8